MLQVSVHHTNSSHWFILHFYIANVVQTWHKCGEKIAYCSSLWFPPLTRDSLDPREYGGFRFVSLLERVDPTFTRIDGRRDAIFVQLNSWRSPERVDWRVQYSRGSWYSYPSLVQVVNLGRYTKISATVTPSTLITTIRPSWRNLSCYKLKLGISDRYE